MMLGLPKTTAINKPLPKKAIFDKFKPSAADRKLVDKQISRLAIVGEISSQTVNISVGNEVLVIYVILITLKSVDCDKRNIALLSKLIDQHMLFILHYNDSARLACYRAGQVLISDNKPLEEWRLNLRGLDLNAVWENIIAQIADIDLSGGRNLDERIIVKERCKKLKKQIATLEKKAMTERQPRRKWEYAEEVRKLKSEMEEIING